MRPDIGTQDKFRKKKAPTTYRYDSSLSPALDWDGQNRARELGEWLLARIEEAAALPAPHAFAEPLQFTGSGGRTPLTVRSLQEAVDALKRLGKPFLTWTGKAERLSFDVPPSRSSSTSASPPAPSSTRWSATGRTSSSRSSTCSPTRSTPSPTR